MIFELQKRSEPDLSGFAQDSLSLPRETKRPKKKGRPRWTPSQKLGSGSELRCPRLKLVRTKSHVRSPSVVIEARNSCSTGTKNFQQRHGSCSTGCPELVQVQENLCIN